MGRGFAAFAVSGLLATSVGFLSVGRPVEAATGHTPGYWKQTTGQNPHTTDWDQLSDPIVQAMPAGLQFTATTRFNAYFSLTPAQSGFSDNVSMLQALSTGGGAKQGLARQAVGALLNTASIPGYTLPAGATDFTSLYNLIRNTYLGTSGYTISALTDALAANNTP